MEGKQEYECKLGNVNRVIDNKEANYQVLKGQLKEYKKRMNELKAWKKSVTKLVKKKGVTYKDGIEDLDTIRSKLSSVGSHIDLKAAYYSDKYIDERIENSAKFHKDEYYRDEWREETRKIIQTLGSKKHLKLLIPRTTAIKLKPRCQLFNQGKCNRKICLQPHHCQECFHFFMLQKHHVFSPQCGVYLLRKKYFSTRKGQATPPPLELSETSSSEDTESSSDTDQE